MKSWLRDGRLRSATGIIGVLEAIALWSIGTTGCGGHLADVKQPAPSGSAGGDPALPLGLPKAGARSSGALAGWKVAEGNSTLGPAVGDGWLALVAGQRVLIKKDGSVVEESVTLPEPLLEIVSVPSTKGTLYFGRSERLVYRFNDPLGAAQAFLNTPERLQGLGSAPERLVVWCGASSPRSFDAATAEERPMENWPSARVDQMKFSSLDRGVVTLGGAGVAVTRDGGRNWQLVPSSSVPAEPHLLMQVGPELALVGNDLPRELMRVDISRAEISPFGNIPLPPMADWLLRIPVEPLQGAVRRGLETQEHDFLVPGWLGEDTTLYAKVSSKTGWVEEVWKGRSCKMLPADAGHVWLDCDASKTANLSHELYYAERKVSDIRRVLSSPSLAKLKFPERSQRFAGNSGSIVVSPCSANANEHCLFTASGQVRRTPNFPGPWQNWLPTHHGLLVGLRSEGRPVMFAQERNSEISVWKSLELAVAEPGNIASAVRNPLTTIKLPEGEYPWHLETFVEAPVGQLHLVFVRTEWSSSTRELLSVVQSLDGGEPQIERFTGKLTETWYSDVGLREDPGKEDGANKFQVTVDGGKRWQEIAVPMDVGGSLRSDGVTVDRRSTKLEVGTLGLLSDRGYAVGFSPTSALRASRPAVGPVLRGWRTSSAGPVGTGMLKCIGTAPPRSIGPRRGPKPPPWCSSTRDRRSQCDNERDFTGDNYWVHRTRDSKGRVQSIEWQPPGSAVPLRYHIPSGDQSHYLATERFFRSRAGSALLISSESHYTLLVLGPDRQLAHIALSADERPRAILSYASGVHPMAWLSEKGIMVWRKGGKPELFLESRWVLGEKPTFEVDKDHQLWATIGGAREHSEIVDPMRTVLLGSIAAPAQAKVLPVQGWQSLDSIQEIIVKPCRSAESGPSVVLGVTEQSAPFWMVPYGGAEHDGQGIGGKGSARVRIPAGDPARACIEELKVWVTPDSNDSQFSSPIQLNTSFPGGRGTRVGDNGKTESLKCGEYK